MCCHTDQHTKAHYGANRVPLAYIHSFAPCALVFLLVPMYMLSHSSLHTFFCNVCVWPWCSCWRQSVYVLSHSSLHTFFCKVCVWPWCSCWCLLVYVLSHRPAHQGTLWRQQSTSSLHTFFFTVCIRLWCSCWCQCTCCHTDQHTKEHYGHYGGNRVSLACIHSCWCLLVYVLSHRPIHQGTSWRQ